MTQAQVTVPSEDSSAESPEARDEGTHDLMGSIGIVVLAAGGSSRLGVPKQLIAFQGMTLLRRAATTALQSGSRAVVVVLGAESETMRLELTGLPVQIVENDRWQEGMASSIWSGLNALLREVPNVSAALFLLCDQPLLTPAILQELGRQYLETQCLVAACGYRDGPGVPALFDRSLFTELLALKGAHGAKRIIVAHQEKSVVVSFPGGDFDIDTPADLERLGGLQTDR